MTQIVLKDLDPVIIERLKACAQRHGRSMLAEVKVILQQVTEAETTPNLSAAYLQLAMQERLLLATIDDRLASAAAFAKSVLLLGFAQIAPQLRPTY